MNARVEAQGAADSHHFAHDIRVVVGAVAEVLTTLNAVTAAKRASILEMSAVAPAPELHGLTVTHAESSHAAVGLVEIAAAQAIALAIHDTVAANRELDILAQAALTRELIRKG